MFIRAPIMLLQLTLVTRNGGREDMRMTDVINLLRSVNQSLRPCFSPSQVAPKVPSLLTRSPVPSFSSFFFQRTILSYTTDDVVLTRRIAFFHDCCEGIFICYFISLDHSVARLKKGITLDRSETSAEVRATVTLSFSYHVHAVNDSEKIFATT